MNTKQEPKPFDLQAALDGAPIMARDGREILEWKYFSLTEEEFKIHYHIKGNLEISMCRINGHWAKYETITPNDLVMKPQLPKTITKYILWGGNDHFGMWVVRTSESKEEIEKLKEYQEATQPKGFFVISETIIEIPANEVIPANNKTNPIIIVKPQPPKALTKWVVFGLVKGVLSPEYLADSPDEAERFISSREISEGYPKSYIFSETTVTIPE